MKSTDLPAATTQSKSMWLAGAILTTMAVVGAVAYSQGSGSVTSDITEGSKDFMLQFLQGRGPYERTLIAALMIGLGNAALIPINILLFVTALLIPGWEAFFAGLLGAEIAALAGYTYGLLIGANLFKKKFGEKFDIITSEIKKDGIKTVVLLCFAPIAPNTLTNVLAGLSRIELWKLVLGTLIGFLPGVAVLTLLGRKMRTLINSPGYQSIIWIVALIGLLALSFYIGRRVKRRLEERATQNKASVAS